MAPARPRQVARCGTDHRDLAPCPAARCLLEALAENAGVAERVPAGLRPDAERVRPRTDGDAGEQPPGVRRDRVHLAVVAAREPEHLAVRRDAAHVRAAAWDPPLRD